MFIINFPLKMLNKLKKSYLAILESLQDNETKEAKIETMMIVLIVIVMFLGISDIFIDNPRYTAWVEGIDLVVCGIFAVELVSRFRSRKGSKWDFFKSSWLEIIAIIPMDILFRYLRIARIVRVLRFGKVAGNVGRFGKLGRMGNTLFKIMKSGGMQRYKRFNKILVSRGKRKVEEKEKSEGLE